MSLEYTNRKGKKYCLIEGITKTGKPKYYFSQKPNGKGKVIDKVPRGYEIYERPENAQVLLIKKIKCSIKNSEKKLVDKLLNNIKTKKSYISNIKGDYLTIYESYHETSLDSEFAGLMGGEAFSEYILSNTDYIPVMRFFLIKEDKRSFNVDIYSFRELGDWVDIAYDSALITLATKYIPLLGTDEFYELF